MVRRARTAGTVTALALVAGVLFTSTPASAAPVLVNFEESISSPDNVQTQYCNAPGTNKGVEFLLPVRLVEPDESANSPTHAATNEFLGAEFEELDAIEIGFTAAQTTVSVKAGLDKTYSFSVTAHLRAYGTETPSGTPVAETSLELGVGPTPIQHDLTVTSASGNIRSVKVEFLGPVQGNAAIEWIDDISFDVIGPPCVTDNLAPVVLITKPAIDGSTVFSAGAGPATMLLGFVATDGVTGTGIARAVVEFHDAAGALLDSFTICGGGLPACEMAPLAVSRTFYTSAPSQATKVAVKAWDFTDKMGSSERTIHVTESTVNLYAHGLEITQGSQSWLPVNTTSRATTPPTFVYPSTPTAVPLVANRRTVVRLFPEIEGTTLRVDDVGAKLRCFTDSSYTSPCAGPSSISPEHRTDKGMTRTIPVRPVDDLDTRRRLLGFSWTFLLPPDWSKAGTIFLEAEIDPPLATAECAGCDDSANKLRVSQVLFQTVPDFDDVVLTVMLNRFIGGGSGTLAPPADIKVAAETFRAMYPVDDITIMRTVGIYGYEDKLSPAGKNACSDILNRMQSSFSNDLKTHKAILAIGDSQAPVLCSGLGRYNGGVAVARSDRPDAVVQEPGHALHLLHAGPPPGHGAECQEIQGLVACDADWPYPHGAIGAFGFDTYSLQVVPGNRIECDTPGVCDDGVDNDGDGKIDEECVGSLDADPPSDWQADPHDFMSYGGCKFWTSPRTWIRLFNAFTDSRLPYPTATAATAGAPTEVVDSEVSSVAVRGSADENGSWTLEPIYELPGVEAPQPTDGTTPGNGTESTPYHVEFRDSDGNLVASHDVEVNYDIVHTGDPATDILPPASFSAVLPSPGEFDTVQLTTGETILSSTTRSDHAPTVQILSPTGDGFDPVDPSVIWTASDEDGQAVEAVVQIRIGDTWQTLGFGMADGTLPVVLDSLPGGTSQVRVVASDGVNNSIATSETFNLVDKPPIVSILAPDGGALHQAGDRVALVGTAYDLEDGVLADNALRWVSDRDGEIGRGSRLDVSSLSIGTHEVKLQATDSVGRVSEEVVVVTIEPRPTINIQPIADAGADKSSPVNLPVVLDGTGSYDANGDALTHHWSIVTSPPGAGVTLSNPDSATPVLSVDTSGIYVIALEVHDGELGSLADEVTVIFTTGDLALTRLEPVVGPPSRLLIGDTADFSYEATVAYEGVAPDVQASIEGVATSDPGLLIMPGSVHLDIGLASGAVGQVELAYNATCITPGNHMARVKGTVVGSDPAFVDADLTNNALTVEFAVECSVPVAINVVPGSERNPVMLSHGVIPVAVLTTTEGEYGLPLAFDATTIDPLSVRFGTPDEVWGGSGAAEVHGRGHVEDALETDEVTLDGDDDMVLHFAGSDTSLHAGDTTACVGGEFVAADRSVLSFFGCDDVFVRR